MSIKLIAMISLLLVCFLGGGCAPARGFDSSLKSIVKPYRFSIVKWEFRAIPGEVNRLVFGRQEKVDDEVWKSLEPKYPLTITNPDYIHNGGGCSWAINPEAENPGP